MMMEFALALIGRWMIFFPHPLSSADTCYSRTGQRGVCKLLKECPSAHGEFYQNIFPTPCGFSGWQQNPIICCHPRRRVKSRIVRLEPAPVYEESGKDFNGYQSSNKEHLIPYGEKLPSHRKKPFRVNQVRSTRAPAPVHEVVEDDIPGEGYTFDIKEVENWNRLSGRRIVPDDDVGFSGDKTSTVRTVPIENRGPGTAALKKCSEVSELVCPNISGVNTSSRAVYNQLLVQGEKTREREFPHMAAIGYGEADRIVWLCGGSLISEKFIMTAAHCLVSQNLGPAQWVHLGAERLQDSLRGGNLEAMPGQTHPIVRRIRHPDYRPPSKYNDIALLELGPAVGDASLPTMSASIYPACLHVEKDDTVARAVATGWGRVGLGEELSPDLLKVELNIVDHSTCNDSYEVEISTTSWLERGIDSSLICAGEPGDAKDTCLGDSGGPLQYITDDSCVHKILAVTSFGKGCGLGNAPGAYTRVSYYISWIENIIWPKK
ncbi:serine protease Hayan-like isoform X1 [Ischnura elegans]|uniref:serine protease Hayan-like isoform X1 n=1 Tax=Ischnura elegans TaxID=197161 RepID=UPI001ED88A63|nr:serine protease Hayan-like isoform X1 [Ischnura elegans]